MAMTLRPAAYFIAVVRDDFRLRLWRRPPLRSSYDLLKQYKVAVGRLGYETPAGLYEISGKSLDPDWEMPDSDWVAPELRGKIVPGGSPDNPLKGAFLALGDAKGVGIHGTAATESLGTPASHGCIRMYEKSARELYRLVPVGTPVYIT